MANPPGSSTTPDGDEEAPVAVSTHDGVRIARIDDGKANAITPAILSALTAALDDVEGDDDLGALLLVGRDGMFSGGFDLSIMRRADRSTFELVTEGGEFVRRCYTSAKPVVGACTGHAVAAGAFLLLGSHYRVGVSGDFRIGLIETQIGMPLPDWAVEISRERLATAQLQQATIEARMYGPDDAAAAGYLDRVVSAADVEAAALSEAGRLADLPPSAYATNAAKLRAGGGKRMAAIIERDRAAADGMDPPPG